MVLGLVTVGLTWSRAEPAVLLKEYPAQIMRGKYSLGKRMVKVGEIVTVQGVKGISAEVTTEHNDHLVVLLADLRALPPPPPPPRLALVKPVPSPAPPPGAAPIVEETPAPTPLPPPGIAPLVPALTLGELRASLPAPSPGEEIKPAGERREIKVRCTHLTKKGRQCTRMTSSPNGFCWQHGGD